MQFLSVENINKIENDIVVLKDVSFEQHQFQKLAIAGETGSGKSTLLKVIAALAQPDSGRVIFQNNKILGPDEKLMPGHQGIAYLSQHFELRNNYWVSEILAYANELSSDDAIKLYRLCRIDHLLQRRTHQLSGGEKQRIALARLLLGAPRLLLLDEPFSNLDILHKQLLKEVIDNLCTELGITCILVSHDPLDVLSWADEIIVLKNGGLIQKGPPTQVYLQPRDHYVAGLFGNYNLLSIDVLQLFKIPIVPGKQPMVRPEGVKIALKPASEVAAKIMSKKFLGSYTQLSVQVNDHKLLLNAKFIDVHVGDIVHLSIMPDNVWYF